MWPHGHLMPHLIPQSLHFYQDSLEIFSDFQKVCNFLLQMVSLSLEIQRSALWYSLRSLLHTLYYNFHTICIFNTTGYAMCTVLCTWRLALQPESTEGTLSYSGTHAIQEDFYVIQCINQNSILRCGISERGLLGTVLPPSWQQVQDVVMYYALLLVCSGMAITIQALYIVQKRQAPEFFYIFYPNFWSTCAYQGLKYYIMFFLFWDN